MFCKISSNVARENGKRWAYGFTMDHLSTKTTRVCLVLNLCYQYKNKQYNEICQLFSRNALPNCCRDHLLPFSHWIQSCLIPGNETTVTMQRRSWMYTRTHLCTHVKKAIWSFWYWDWNIPRWKFHTGVAFCKHHQVISSRHVHDGMTISDKPQVWINVFLSSTGRIPTTCAISVLLDENEICFYVFY